MKKYLDQVNATKKTGIIAAAGDRRAEDVRNLGRYAAQMFDEIIIRHDRDNRGRTKEELTQLLLDGIREVDNTIAVSIISDEVESVQHAIDHAKTGEFIFLCADDIQTTLAYVEEQKMKDNALINLVPMVLKRMQV